MLSPILLVMLLFCVAPLAIFAAGVAYGRRGSPVSVQWNWRRSSSPAAELEE